MKAKTSDEKRRRILNVVIVVGIFVIAIGGYLVWNALSADSGQLTAVVHDGDGGVKELSLSEDTTYTATTSKGTNVVVVSDGTVRVDSADCPNQDCVEQGAVSQVGRQIVCLPHELWVEVVDESGSSSGGEFDAIGS